MLSDPGARLRDDHPRLFISADTVDAVVRYARTEEADAFERMRARADRTIESGVDRDDHGDGAAEAAFLYLATDDRAYLELAKELLTASLAHYLDCYDRGVSVDWKSHSRINAWAAFDWIWNDLAPETRNEIGAEFLALVDQVQPTDERDPFDRENWSGPRSGFYGTPSQLWPAGVVAHGEGIDDELAARFLQEGFDLNMELLEFRAGLAGDDGGSATGSLGYALVAYPWAEFNFFHTVASATGYDIAADWPYVSLLTGFLFWNWLPGDREFGTGDAYHTSNQLPIEQMDMHLSQIIHFYGDDREEEAAFAKWLRRRTPRESSVQALPIPFARFIVHDRSPGIQPSGPPEDLPHGRHFEGLGQTFFRSGSGKGDTYATFIGGGEQTKHRHFDANHFGIYKTGFLALDSGTRPEPGNHLSHYYCRSAAHNTVLIHMPGEEMPGYWGGPAETEAEEPYPNDGGQRDRLGSTVTAFETNRSYSYIACDATEAYHSEKCGLALRQFVFVPPNTFVVFDRVESTRPEYEKTWLLHTATEPTVEERTFSAGHEGGRLFGRTVLPGDAEVTTVGGPGNQFRAGGTNWPIPSPEHTHIDETDENPFLGQWRVEVTPGGSRARDHFLHVLRVDARLARDLPGPLFSPPKDPAKKAALSDRGEAVDAELVSESERVGLRFEADGREHEVRFGTEGGASGSIRIEDGGSVAVDERLTDAVEPQSGLFG